MQLYGMEAVPASFSELAQIFSIWKGMPMPRLPINNIYPEDISAEGLLRRFKQSRSSYFLTGCGKVWVKISTISNSTNSNLKDITIYGHTIEK
jgi:hypothetical protein